MNRPAPDLVTLLRGEAARAMMPGWAIGDDAPPEAAEPDALREELLMLHLVVALRRVKTWPGSGDQAFVEGLRGKRFAAMTVMERERLLALSWRYRVQLPVGLRAKSEPAVRKYS